jgi:hypothetical protein
LLYAANVVVRYNLFVADSSQQHGGAIYLGNSSNIRMLNNTIDSCVSLNNTGGGISYIYCTNDTSFNNIITNCSGYGIWQLGSSGYLANYDDCWSNLPSDYTGITPGAVSLSVDPRFVGGIPFNYHLQGSSPCINAGNPDPLYNDPDGSRNDMGRYFYANLPPASFDLLLPADQLDSSVWVLNPTFSWQGAVDPDTADLITYTLYIASDSQFVFAAERTGIKQAEYTPDFDLVWSTRYWWKARATDGGGITVWSNSVFTFRTSVPGDANDDASVNIAENVFLVNYIFMNGAAPEPMFVADSNCDGSINIADVVHLIIYIFSGGLAPCADLE